jgi:hypothetical protein
MGITSDVSAPTLRTFRYLFSQNETRPSNDSSKYANSVLITLSYILRRLFLILVGWLMTPSVPRLRVYEVGSWDEWRIEEDMQASHRGLSEEESRRFSQGADKNHENPQSRRPMPRQRLKPSRYCIDFSCYLAQKELNTVYNWKQPHKTKWNTWEWSSDCMGVIIVQLFLSSLHIAQMMS